LAIDPSSEDVINVYQFLYQMQLVQLDKPKPVDNFKRIFKNLNGAREVFAYITWKVHKEKRLDANALVLEECCN
jgi:hypothetical protein